MGHQITIIRQIQGMSELYGVRIHRVNTVKPSILSIRDRQVEALQGNLVLAYLSDL